MGRVTPCEATITTTKQLVAPASQGRGKEGVLHTAPATVCGRADWPVRPPDLKNGSASSQGPMHKPVRASPAMAPVDGLIERPVAVGAVTAPTLAS